VSKDAKAHIIEAAKRVIARNGIHNASIQSIVEEAGISKGALYHYYKNKDALLYDIMDQSLKVSTDIANKAKSGQYTSEELQEILVDGIIERFAKKDDNRIQYYLSQEAMQGNGELHALLEKVPVEAHAWAIFPNEGPFPATLQQTMAQIYAEWLPSSNYEVINAPTFSFTKMDEHRQDYAYSEVWIPVRKK
jgi:AcrR family transcriptional regulator